MGTPGIYAVMGKPVLHSRSPAMHNAAFRALGLDAIYIRIAAGSAAEGLETARGMGLSGMNVTSPFKGIIGSLDSADALAKRIGAVNTVLFRDGRALGYNTDARGVSDSLLKNGVEIMGKGALVLGAGGAARAAVAALTAEGAGVTVANRTAEKAEALAGEFGGRACGIGKDELEAALEGCSIVVGCLGTGETVVPPGLLRGGMAVLDAHYASESALVRDARAAGCRVIDGREWLVRQGAESFRLFTGREAPLDAMRAAAFAPKKVPAGRGIALVGMMGSGKNSVAKELSARTGMPVIDTDAEAEKAAGMDISGIFRKQGESAFRGVEEGIIAGICPGRPAIISCGGGAVLSERNRTHLREIAAVVWLWAAPAALAARLPRDGKRPLLDGGEPERRLEGILRDRMGAYADACDMVVATERKTPGEAAERILHEIR